jgi:methionine-S-sulfoxide reductase
MPLLKTLRVPGLILALLAPMAACAAERAVVIEPPALDAPKAPGPTQKVVIAGGCFWGVQGVYQHMKGVRNVLSGYSGGEARTAKYKYVGDGDTGHAEAVEIEYDPAQVSYGEILHVFFSVVHDPTQLDRQGPDVGPQYRSAIFVADAGQRKIAVAYIAQLNRSRAFGKRIVTKIEPLKKFYPAEEYHQDYLVLHPNQPYIAYNDIPKVQNFEKLFPAFWEPAPKTVANYGTRKLPSAAVRTTPPAVGAAMMMSAAADTPAAAQPEAGGAMMSANAMMSAKPAAGAGGAGNLTALTRATGWVNSKPLTAASLKGKVVVVDFWTYSCINCLRALPHINAWYDHYKNSGLVVVGVHSPEFGFEKDAANVQRAVKDFGIHYPVALDADMSIWNAFSNRFWPAHYFIDAKGELRDKHFGEGKYERSERIIRKLLTEAGVTNLPDPLDGAVGQGAHAPSDTASVASPETYVGYERAENFASPGSFTRNAAKDYLLPSTPLALNQWALAGRWQVAHEMAANETAGGRIAFRFKARDLHLVLGPAAGNKPVRYRVTIDGKAPGADHGVDVDAQGLGTVREQRLYQLIRQKGAVQEHEFVIEFLDAGVEAYAFTFG